MALRYERLDDEGLFGGIDQVLQEITATAEYKFAEGFLVRGEFRRDWSNRTFFTGTASRATARPPEHALIGLVWWVRQQKRGLVGPRQRRDMLLLGMIVLGLFTFAAMLAFVRLCDRV